MITFPTVLMSPAGITRLKLDEGYRSYAYDDATGLTVDAPQGNLSVGYGTNLAVGLSLDEATFLMLMRVAASEAKLEAALNTYATFSDVQRDVLAMIDYNTGNVLAWPNLITSIVTYAPAIQQANNVRKSDAWNSTLTRLRYERFAQALINGHW